MHLLRFKLLFNTHHIKFEFIITIVYKNIIIIIKISFVLSATITD